MKNKYGGLFSYCKQRTRTQTLCTRSRSCKTGLRAHQSRSDRTPPPIDRCRRVCRAKVYPSLTHCVLASRPHTPRYTRCSRGIKTRRRRQARRGLAPAAYPSCLCVALDAFDCSGLAPRLVRQEDLLYFTYLVAGFRKSCLFVARE